MISIHKDQSGLISKLAHKYSRHWQTFDDGADLDSVAQLVTDFAWSPCIWAQGERKTSNFRCADYIALDFDKPPADLQLGLEMFRDYKHVIGTTRRHGKPDDGGLVCDRYRVILVLSERCRSSSRFKATAEYLAREFHSDPSPKDAGRFFFDCEEIVSVKRTGLAVTPVKPDHATSHPTYAALATGDYEIPKRIYSMLENGVADGNRNNACYQVGCELYKAGYDRYQIVEIIMQSLIPLGPHVRREVSETVGRAIKHTLTRARY